MVLVVAAMEQDFQKIRVGAASEVAGRTPSGSITWGGACDSSSWRPSRSRTRRQIVIRPWDPGSLRAIGTAISQSRSGLTPTIDGGAIRIYVPALTEERRNGRRPRAQTGGAGARRDGRSATRHAAIRARERRHVAGPTSYRELDCPTLGDHSPPRSTASDGGATLPRESRCRVPSGHGLDTSAPNASTSVDINRR